jgi:hypothetical protein
MADYTLAQEGAEEFERSRLGLLEEVCDPHTIRQMNAIGGRRGVALPRRRCGRRLGHAPSG